MSREEDIYYQHGKFWVYKVDSGYYEVNEDHDAGFAIVRGTFHYSNDDQKAKDLAIAHCDKLHNQQ